MTTTTTGTGYLICSVIFCNLRFYYYFASFLLFLGAFHVLWREKKLREGKSQNTYCRDFYFYLFLFHFILYFFFSPTFKMGRAEKNSLKFMGNFAHKFNTSDIKPESQKKSNYNIYVYSDTLFDS